MHLEFLIEDRSGKEALQLLVPKIVGPGHTYNIHAYRGIGHLPKGLGTVAEPQHRALLSQLPRLLQGYGKTFNSYPKDYKSALILVCDLDRECRKLFRDTLLDLLNKCNPRPTAYFCIAEEELESWFLGDEKAVCTAYSKAKLSAIEAYAPDSICGTWEVLADAVYVGGSKELKKKQWNEIGLLKSAWAREITPHMDIDANTSPSFNYFRDKLRSLTRIDTPSVQSTRRPNQE
jgi:hypothetical protein